MFYYSLSLQLPSLIRQSQSVYCGFDPTSDSLHLGNLLPMILLLHLQKEGLTPIVVVGDATAKVGDPSGRLTERSTMEQDIIENNSKGLEKNIRTVFDNYKRYFHYGNFLPNLQLVRNSYWYLDQTLDSFVGTVERHFRLSKMLNRESVRQRLNSPGGMSVTEFSYQIFQAYDWLRLYEMYTCCVQIGGQDQMGNIESGHDLIKRTHGENCYGFMTPIITTVTGEKFGKSVGNAIWLSPTKTSPQDLYNFLLQRSDTEAVQLVQLFTFLNDEELRKLLCAHRDCPKKKLCQKKLASDVTTLVHGEEGLSLALTSGK
ncbi:tyrosine--tRNA ligase, mitochondrial-like isoform X2 [Varroa jacobsoni]|uniref:tyrosine--tRNA ligase, mitochondrial-like isoform X2 n=1 Tax=Varroa jacobsoni TaxID=62625 RepID=UPI000BF39A4A|nr:tyrosine--tRNA ligase, mitochondrial-like isoform X2 [Varroa jacobsoni]